MNRFIGLTTAVLVAAVAGTALADGGVRINAGFAGYTGGIGIGGGAFTATTLNSGYIGEFSGPGSSLTSFQTFCLQLNENLAFGGNYTAAISTFTVLEGLSNYDPSGPTAPTSTGSDDLSSTTALLYSTFRNGGNFGGSWDGLSTTDLTLALQLAIWFSEGELTNGTTFFSLYANYTSNTLALNLFAWASNPLHNLGSLWDVRVLQLFNSDRSNAQDILTIVPLPPAAYAGLGTLAGVIGMGYIRRRRHANA